MSRAKKKPVKKRKPVKNPVYNIHHHDYADKFELAFTCKGRKFYRCIKEFHYPVGRYKFIAERFAEADLRVTTKLLKDYVEAIKKQFIVHPGGTINLNKIEELVINLGTHVDLEFSPMTIKRLAAVVFIDETENITDFDQEYGDKKIKLWEDAGDYTFFLTRPISELLNANSTSEEYLMKFINKISVTEKSLISDLYSLLSESTLKNQNSNSK